MWMNYEATFEYGFKRSVLENQPPSNDLLFLCCVCMKRYGETQAHYCKRWLTRFLQQSSCGIYYYKNKNECECCVVLRVPFPLTYTRRLVYRVLAYLCVCVQKIIMHSSTHSPSYCINQKVRIILENLWNWGRDQQTGQAVWLERKQMQMWSVQPKTHKKQVKSTTSRAEPYAARLHCKIKNVNANANASFSHDQQRHLSALNCCTLFPEGFKIKLLYLCSAVAVWWFRDLDVQFLYFYFYGMIHKIIACFEMNSILLLLISWFLFFIFHVRVSDLRKDIKVWNIASP
jgi:hypothetical protein